MRRIASVGVSLVVPIMILIALFSTLVQSVPNMSAPTAEDMKPHIIMISCPAYLVHLSAVLLRVVHSQ